MMRIVNLTPAVERRLMQARQRRDAEAERVAARIVRDVQRRGDAALQAWTKKLDGVDLRRESRVDFADARSTRRRSP